MGQPDIDAARAVDAGVVVLSVHAVHVRPQRAARRVGLGVLERRRCRAGHQVDQRLVVTILVQREIDDLLRLQLSVQVALVGLQQLRGRFDRHASQLDGSDFEPRLDAADLTGGDRYIRLYEFAKALQPDLHVVTSGLKVRNGVLTVFGADRFLGQVGVFVHDGYGSRGDSRSRGVLDDADDAAVKNLCV